MRVQEAYNKWSDTYDTDTNATRDLDRIVLKRLFGGKRFKSVIEAGCGTGKNTELLARVGKKVRALDFSEGMISKAKEKHGQLSNVTFSVTDITKRWPCVEHSADLVTCHLVLEHVEHFGSVFSEAARVLVKGGVFFISELHPFRQYAGVVANFRRGEETTRIPAFVHHISDFLKAAEASGFKLKSVQEWWHDKDEGKPPRLVSFLFEA